MIIMTKMLLIGTEIRKIDETVILYPFIASTSEFFSIGIKGTF